MLKAITAYEVLILFDSYNLSATSSRRFIKLILNQFYKLVC